MTISKPSSGAGGRADANDQGGVKEARAFYGVNSTSQTTPCEYRDDSLGGTPRDWYSIELGELATFRTGPFGSALHKSDYVDGGVPLINPMHIQDGLLVPDSSTSVSEVAAQKLAAFRMQSGDIVMGRRGDMGRCAVVKCEQSGWLCGTGSLIIKCGRLAEASFLQRILASDRVIQAIEDSSVGTTMINLNQAALSKIVVSLPAMPEQRAIAEALSDVDGLLGALDALIAKKHAIKQAAMQQLLTGKTRLPGFSGPWESLSLGELEKRGHIKLSRGKVISQRDINRNQGDYPIYSSSVHSNGLFGCYGDYMFDEELISWSVDGGGHFFYRPKHRFSVTNVCGYMRIRTSRVNCRFFAYQLQELHSHKFFDYTMKAHPSVIRGAYQVDLPGVLEQVAIATALSNMDAEIAALEASRDKACAIKQGMMQQLLTGRVRLVQPTIATPEDAAP